MPLLSRSKWKVAKAIANIGYVNPFLEERIELEKEALGKEFRSFKPFLQYRPECSVSDMFPNAPMLRIKGGELLEEMREKLISHESATDLELDVYENLALFQLYARYMSNILNLPVRSRHRPEDDVLNAYDAYIADYKHFLKLPGRPLPSKLNHDIIFAGLFQVERAFFHIFNYVVGGSLAAAKLRAAIWQSIFTHDMRRYLRSLYQYMGDVTTLITGPSGTGKDLVAQSIAYSRFVPFDSRNRRFVINYTKSLVSLNLTAIAPTLIESELFGHAKGAFTDAKSSRHGHLDESRCQKWGTVFLDEIGELDSQIQVKLLRVLQNREFRRVGESQTRNFVGKIVAATNRNLEVEMQSGRFREDFYYRLCADRIETPSLRSQLQNTPEDLNNFVHLIATRLLPEVPAEADRLADDAVSWIETELDADYPWPGNIRDLEQCVRSIMVRGSYVSTRPCTIAQQSPVQELLGKVEKCELGRNELLIEYFSLVYAKLGSFRAAGRKLGVDWRTVRDLVDDNVVRRFVARGTT